MRGLLVGMVILWWACAPAAAQTASEQMVEATISGTVSDEEGLGLGGVQVKVFVAGFLRGSAITGGDGTYSTGFRYDEIGDETIVVWWVPQAGYVPEIVVLRESATAKGLELWSPCLPRLGINPSVRYDPTIYEERRKFETLGESDCIEKKQ